VEPATSTGAESAGRNGELIEGEQEEEDDALSVGSEEVDADVVEEADATREAEEGRGTRLASDFSLAMTIVQEKSGSSRLSCIPATDDDLPRLAARVR
jgi:hypothetical protein